MDFFLYSGDIQRGQDLKFIKFVSENKASDELTLILCTPGGAPDAAYKIGRYLQTRYEKVKVFVPGFCKSAGTLLAISADELIFSPYGELGPLDIQMAKADDLGGLESGLNISEAFLTLEKRAKDTFHDLVIEITGNSGGIISFQTASHSASEIVSSLFGPIFARIDPEEVGSRARAMRIGEDYGNRLNFKFKNLQPGALDLLSQSYTSHGFVIDKQEAEMLFKRVREASDVEKQIVEQVGDACRLPERSLRIENLTELYSETLASEKPDEDDEPKATKKPRRSTRKKKANGRDSQATV